MFELYKDELRLRSGTITTLEICKKRKEEGFKLQPRYCNVDSENG